MNRDAVTASSARLPRVRRTRSPFRAYLRRHRFGFALGMAITAAGSFAATIPPRFIGEIIDQLGDGTTMSVVVPLGGLMLLASAVEALLRAGGQYTIVSLARTVEYDLRADLFAHLQTLHLAYYQHQRIGDLMARMTNDLNVVRTMMGAGFMTLTMTLTTLFFAVGAMLALN